MKKRNLKNLFLFGGMVAMVAFSSCVNRQKNTDETEKQEESGVPAGTVEVSIFQSMPVKGDRAEYFSLEVPEGQTTIKIVGTPDEEYKNRGALKANVDISVLKNFKEKIYNWGDYYGMTLHILNEDKEDIGYLRMGDTDKDLIEAELGKANPGKVNVIFKYETYEPTYSKIMDNAKYVRLEGATFKGEKEHEKEYSSSSSSSSSSSRSSVSNSSSDDDDSDYDEDKERIKEKAKEVKEKAKEKGRELKEKALDKLNDWLD